MAMFARRHYQAVADMMVEIRPAEMGDSFGAQWWNVMVEAHGVLFSRDNPKFDLARFKRACMASKPNGKVRH